MIKRYSDHAANERTFLAWVRTAIAVMAFGFLIERFDLFLRYIAPQAAQPQAAPRSEAFANWAGLAFIVLGPRLYRARHRHDNHCWRAPRKNCEGHRNGY
jgi:putative membrane protein